MGNCLRIHKKHIIEYGSEGYFLRCWETKEFLTDLGCCVCGELNEDNIGDWEINASQFESALDKIRAMPAGKVRRYFKNFRDEDSDEKVKTYIVNLFDNFIKTGDKHTGYYHFSWF